MLLERAGIETANLHEERIRNMPDGKLFDVISNGAGLMPAYRFPISPRDRWAIIAYLRKLEPEGNEP